VIEVGDDTGVLVVPDFLEIAPADALDVGAGIGAYGGVGPYLGVGATGHVNASSAST